MIYEWKNKVVLITGGATGIGAKVAKKVLEEGAKYVAILDINKTAGTDYENELISKHGARKAKFILCDVTDEEKLVGSFKEVVESQGGLDVVINNAGIMNDGLKVYRKMIDLNLTALVTGTLKAIHYMSKENGGQGGTVINISSIVALFQSEHFPIYYSTKSAVLQFSNCVGRNEYFKRTGVRVMTICFGATRTSLSEVQNLGCFDPTVERKLEKDMSLQRYQTVESAAQAVVDAYKQASSGSTWLSIEDLPVKDITATITKAYATMSAEVFKANKLSKY